MPQSPFSIRIFVADGDPDGLRLVECSNWVGKAPLFPRSHLPQVKKRDEFQQTGVYLLLGPEEVGDSDMLYIGEGDPVLPRLESHFAKKDFWTRAVFFVSSAGQPNKAHVQYLEHRLIEIAKDAKRMALDNIQTPSRPTLAEADQADMEVFLEYILGILPVLGIHAFEQPPVKRVSAASRLYLSAPNKGIQGSGTESSQGFTVFEGSDVSPTEVASIPVTITQIRAKLRAAGVIGDVDGTLKFTQDYSFSSPSQAACIILGRSANGRIEWSDQAGRTLKAIQEAQVPQAGGITAARAPASCC
ncbi:GIY-YIG nuclease family protein [Marinobacterium aestuariivivens]|uniref:GIY-YIG nuclease family protein n=1 Tax=Marinobacterium aestuariivivens TaxID=1698799 RepID=A0ABW2A7G7_9GAMM